MKLVVIYNYFEEGRESVTHLNYLFFMKNGYYEDNNIHYIFVINGKCTIELIKKPNIIIFQRSNSGFDFGAYGYALRSINLIYEYYFFLNSSARGPFIIHYSKIRWYEPFIELMKNNIKLVGPSINTYINRPHVQTYAFMLDFESVIYLLDKIFNVEYNNLIDVVNNQEVNMSTIILSNNWNINCLIPELSNINWVNNLYPKHKYINKKYDGDMLYSGKLCNGRDLHPYELIFVKINRNLSVSEINSLTEYLMNN